MSLKPRLNKIDSLKLLLICAMPIHYWTILMIFRDAQNLLDERNLAYTIGASGYLLGLAILEGLLLFAFIYLLTFLFPKKWEDDTVFAAASAFGLIIAFWAISNQLFFLLNEISPAWFEWIRLRVYYRQHQVYPLVWLVVILSAAWPALLLPRSKSALKIQLSLTEKILFLVPLYLLLDLVGITFTLVGYYL